MLPGQYADGQAKSSLKPTSALDDRLLAEADAMSLVGVLG